MPIKVQTHKKPRRVKPAHRVAKPPKGMSHKKPATYLHTFPFPPAGISVKRKNPKRR